MKKLTTSIILILLTFKGFSQDIYTFGPMVHLNFGGGSKANISYGLEFAYWNIDHFPYSIDGGIEYGKKKLRIYSELQTGIGAIGLGAGPVYQFNFTGKTSHLGFQTTYWANYFLGVDYRKRWIEKSSFNCIGLYLKLPIAPNSNSNNNSSSHHSSHGWD